ncbi:hypothetical protein [Novosphingobium aureum]|uniref:hypothetical protein n=1 Tax=Novosphingobium aureum TaxID=2792964 RepID=UPI0018CDE8DD|nr:hypothetical protein [Novosphingobium aureum]
MSLREPLAALRRDDGEWRAGQAALEQALAAWRSDPSMASVLEAMERFAAGETLAGCRPLAALFQSGNEAASLLVERFVSGTLLALDAHPLGQMPLAYAPGDVVAMLVLARCGTASLTLSCFDGCELARAEPRASVVFEPVESWSRVIAGSGTGELIIGEPTAASDTLVLQRRELELASDSIHHRIGAREKLHVRSASGAMLVLRLQRALPGEAVVREHALADGRLVHRAAAAADDSRRELAMATLRAMERRDAVPGMRAIALGRGEVSLRWQALRELLVLDLDAGLDAIDAIAAASDDPLCAHVGTLREAVERQNGDETQGGSWPS